MQRFIAVVSGVGCLFMLGVAPAASAQNQSYQEWLVQDRAAFKEYSETVSRQYEEFVEQEKKAFKAFVEAAGQVWGEDDVWVPEPKVWVQYSEDLEERSGVDCEQGGACVRRNSAHSWSSLPASTRSFPR